MRFIIRDLKEYWLTRSQKVKHVLEFIQPHAFALIICWYRQGTLLALALDQLHIFPASHEHGEFFVITTFLFNS